MEESWAASGGRGGQRVGAHCPQPGPSLVVPAQSSRRWGLGSEVELLVDSPGGWQTRDQAYCHTWNILEQDVIKSARYGGGESFCYVGLEQRTALSRPVV